MIDAALADDIIARHADTIRRDVEAILAVAASADLPAGVAVLPAEGSHNAVGISIGSGHALALANGCEPGAVAVRVDVAGILRGTLAAEPGDAPLAIDVSRQLIEQVAAHELAHALVAEPDRAGTVAEAAALVAGADARPVRAEVDAHGPWWAAAVVVLSGRVIRLRPPHERPGRESAMRSELSAYGLDAEAVSEALGDVADAVGLRELLVSSGDVARRVAAACRPEAERQASIIEHRRLHGAAGDGAGVSREERIGVV